MRSPIDPPEINLDDPDCGCVPGLTPRSVAGGGEVSPDVMSDGARDEGSNVTRSIGSLVPETTTHDWQLLRKFNRFWPRDSAGPVDFPWLADLVSRQKAWLWVSQFPNMFRDVEASNNRFILNFIAQTLTAVDPIRDGAAPGGDSGGGLPTPEAKKTCCKGRETPNANTVQDGPPDYMILCGPPCNPGEGIALIFDFPDYEWTDCAYYKECDGGGDNTTAIILGWGDTDWIPDGPPDM
jgi:hypothetical protein